MFSLDRAGQADAFAERGMTYIGGDEAFGGSQPNDRFEHIENQAEITPISPDAYTAEVNRGEGWWTAFWAIPWSLVGGFPREDRFALQFYRKRQLTGEILCPVPQDVYINLHYWFEYDPALFMEACLGGSPKPIYFFKKL